MLFKEHKLTSRYLVNSFSAFGATWFIEVKKITAQFGKRLTDVPPNLQKRTSRIDSHCCKSNASNTSTPTFTFVSRQGLLVQLAWVGMLVVPRKAQ